MIYISASIIFLSFFFILSLIFLFRSKISKNYKRISIIERKLLWKIPRIYNYIYALSPKMAELILTKHRDRQIEEDLFDPNGERVRKSYRWYLCYGDHLGLPG